jgi:hypothetical protein
MVQNKSNAAIQNFIIEHNERLKYYKTTLAARTGRKNEEEVPVAARA